MNELIEELLTFGISIHSSALAKFELITTKYKAKDVLNTIVAGSIKHNITTVNYTILDDVDKQLAGKLQRIHRRQADIIARDTQFSSNHNESKLIIGTLNTEEFKELLILNEGVKRDYQSSSDIQTAIIEIEPMYMKCSCNQKALVMDQLIIQMENMFLEQSKGHSVHDLRFKYKDCVYICGQIYYNRTYDGTSQMYIRGSLRNSYANSVEISLESCQQYCVFPGQIVVAYGRNFEDRRFQIKEFYKINPSPVCSMKDVTFDTDIVAACGPFLSLNKENAFAPLKTLLAYAFHTQPNILLLIGPFIDDKIDLNDGSFNTIMCEFIDLLNQASECGLSSEIMLVPSFADLNCDYVFPQPPLVILNNKDIISISDPGMFKINNIFINVTSVDILLHMKSHCTFKKTISDSELISEFVTQLFVQRSIYPLFPSENEVPLDICKLQKLSMFEILPNILIMPSDTAQFIQLYKHNDDDSTLVVNPGRLNNRNNLLVNSFAHIGYNVKNQSFFGKILQCP